MHAFDPLTPLEETLRTLDDFVQAGKIHYYGLSNFTGWQLTKTVHLARALGSPSRSPCSRSTPCIVREIEWEVVPAVLDAGMGMLPWSPLGGGWLSGKYRRDQRPTGDTRLGDDPVAAWRPGSGAAPTAPGASSTPSRRSPRTRGVSMAEVALAWVTDRPGGDLDDPRRPHRQAARGQPAVGRPAAHRRASSAALDEASDLGAADYPYGAMGIEQREPQPRRPLIGGRVPRAAVGT